MYIFRFMCFYVITHFPLGLAIKNSPEYILFNLSLFLPPKLYNYKVTIVMAIYIMPHVLSKITLLLLFLSRRHGTKHTNRFSKVTDIGELQLKTHAHTHKNSTQRGWPFWQAVIKSIAIAIMILLGCHILVLETNCEWLSSPNTSVLRNLLKI